VTMRQKEIVEQSIALIARRGIQELTIRNLARAIGISEPAIYRHFPSKTDILLGVLDALEQETSAKALPAPASEVALTISNYFRRLVDHLSAAPDLAAVIFADEVFLNDERLAVRVRELMERSVQNMELLLATGQHSKEFREDIPASDLASMLIGTVRFIVRRWHLSGFAFDLSGRCLGALESFLVLIEPPAP
jgi:AcrR family transcriptional regulator